LPGKAKCVIWTKIKKVILPRQGEDGAFMFKRAGTWLMLIWAIAWFVFIVPGHTRGVIQLAPDPFAAQESNAKKESSKAQETCGDCCTLPKGKPGDGEKPRPFMGKCALCDNVAKTVGAEPLVIDLPLIGLLTLLEPGEVFTLSGVEFLVVPHSRGPPFLFEHA
jgi:hypothetical protein